MSFFSDVWKAMKQTAYEFQAGPRAKKKRKPLRLRRVPLLKKPTPRPMSKEESRIKPKRKVLKREVWKGQRLKGLPKQERMFIKRERATINKIEPLQDWEKQIEQDDSGINQKIEPAQDRVKRIVSEPVKKKVRENRRFYATNMSAKRRHLLFMNPGTEKINEAVVALRTGNALPKWAQSFSQELSIRDEKEDEKMAEVPDAGSLLFEGLPMLTKDEKRREVKLEYFNPKGFSTIGPITDALQKRFANVSRANVTHILRSLETYQRNFGRRRPPKVMGRMMLKNPGVIAMDMFFPTRAIAGWEGEEAEAATRLEAVEERAIELQPMGQSREFAAMPTQEELDASRGATAVVGDEGVTVLPGETVGRALPPEDPFNVEPLASEEFGDVIAEGHALSDQVVLDTLRENPEMGNMELLKVMQGVSPDRPFEFETGRNMVAYRRYFRMWDGERTAMLNQGTLPDSVMAPDAYNPITDLGLEDTSGIELGVIRDFSTRVQESDFAFMSRMVHDDIMQNSSAPVAVSNMQRELMRDVLDQGFYEKWLAGRASQMADDTPIIMYQDTWRDITANVDRAFARMGVPDITMNRPVIEPSGPAFAGTNPGEVGATEMANIRAGYAVQDEWEAMTYTLEERGPAIIEMQEAGLPPANVLEELESPFLGIPVPPLPIAAEGTVVATIADAEVEMFEAPQQAVDLASAELAENLPVVEGLTAATEGEILDLFGVAGATMEESLGGAGLGALDILEGLEAQPAMIFTSFGAGFEEIERRRQLEWNYANQWSTEAWVGEHSVGRVRVFTDNQEVYVWDGSYGTDVIMWPANVIQEGTTRVRIGYRDGRGRVHIKEIDKAIVGSDGQEVKRKWWPKDPAEYRRDRFGNPDDNHDFVPRKGTTDRHEWEYTTGAAPNILNPQGSQQTHRPGPTYLQPTNPGPRFMSNGVAFVPDMVRDLLVRHSYELWFYDDGTSGLVAHRGHGEVETWPVGTLTSPGTFLWRKCHIEALEGRHLGWRDDDADIWALCRPKALPTPVSVDKMFWLAITDNHPPVLIASEESDRTCAAANAAKVYFRNRSGPPPTDAPPPPPVVEPYDIFTGNVGQGGTGWGSGELGGYTPGDSAPEGYYFDDDGVLQPLPTEYREGDPEPPREIPLPPLTANPWNEVDTWFVQNPYQFDPFTDGGRWVLEHPSQDTLDFEGAESNWQPYDNGYETRLAAGDWDRFRPGFEYPVPDFLGQISQQRLDERQILQQTYQDLVEEAGLNKQDTHDYNAWILPMDAAYARNQRWAQRDLLRDRAAAYKRFMKAYRAGLFHTAPPAPIIPDYFSNRRRLAPDGLVYRTVTSSDKYDWGRLFEAFTELMHRLNYEISWKANRSQLGLRSRAHPRVMDPNRPPAEIFLGDASDTAGPRDQLDWDLTTSGGVKALEQAIRWNYTAGDVGGINFAQALLFAYLRETDDLGTPAGQLTEYELLARQEELGTARVFFTALYKPSDTIKYGDYNVDTDEMWLEVQRELDAIDAALHRKEQVEPEQDDSRGNFDVAPDMPSEAATELNLLPELGIIADEWKNYWNYDTVENLPPKSVEYHGVFPENPLGIMVYYHMGAAWTHGYISQINRKTVKVMRKVEKKYGRDAEGKMITASEMEKIGTIKKEALYPYITGNTGTPTYIRFDVEREKKAKDLADMPPPKPRPRPKPGAMRDASQSRARSPSPTASDSPPSEAEEEILPVNLPLPDDSSSDEAPILANVEDPAWDADNAQMDFVDFERSVSPSPWSRDMGQRLQGLQEPIGLPVDWEETEDDPLLP